MEQTLLHFLDQAGYFGVFVLIALENIFPPLPSELILTFTGYLTLHTQMNLLGSALAATAGAVVGALALYWVGYLFNLERLEKLVHTRFGRMMRLKMSDFEKAARFLQKHGRKAVFFGRFVPVVRSLISLPAGMEKMPLTPFILLTAVGSFIWNVVLIFAGQKAGSAWNQVAQYLDDFSLLFAIGFAALLLFGAYQFYQKRFKQKVSHETKVKQKEMD
ncbi:hypothetical protein IV38_GL001116 [Lactobacillus selangorensis]|uniref:VTT domain-containing protein n=1 Tax=Lactobacillus selangorensis TaxID=81857 RepID=A0A0R2FUK5_9LACO|nr:DedA family protein [Lactobacillus selangorensis]KRN28908.1 hypothetical protein IV38_GL001116 [Lactobacillus selangorensis]KRN32682.1 hypothetical protein IV40_GL000737 [Lactobacillus selangorensis]